MKTNWKNKLKEVLEKDDFSGIYTKTPLTKTDETRSDLVSSVFVSGHLGLISKKISQEKTFNVSGFVFSLQKSGVKFYVSPQFFETGGRALTADERQTLKNYADGCLCHLHQAKLTECIFRAHKDFLEQFKYEVSEREAIFLEDETEDANAAHYDAVRLVSHEWFCHFHLTGNLV